MPGIIGHRVPFAKGVRSLHSRKGIFHLYTSCRGEYFFSHLLEAQNNKRFSEIGIRMSLKRRVCFEYFEENLLLD